MKGLLEGNPDLLFYISLTFSVIVIRLPFIGRYFRSVNTLLHESGHALVAILSSGEVLRIELSSDTSGVAVTRSKSGFKAFLVSASGYPFAAAASLLLLAFAVSGMEKWALFVLMTFSLLNLAFFVRNAYGVIWIVTFSSIMLLLYWLENLTAIYLFTITTSLVSLAESVFSTLQIFYLGFASPKKAGDLSNMAKFSGIPAWFWALTMLIVVGVIVYSGIIRYFPIPDLSHLTSRIEFVN